jgi:hypothetical protein
VQHDELDVQREEPGVLRDDMAEKDQADDDEVARPEAPRQTPALVIVCRDEIPAAVTAPKVRVG